MNRNSIAIFLGIITWFVIVSFSRPVGMFDSIFGLVAGVIVYLAIKFNNKK
jgi:ABC-type uncharacterized transport system permease subunit